jgi:hypothetical protein
MKCSLKFYMELPKEKKTGNSRYFLNLKDFDLDVGGL